MNDDNTIITLSPLEDGKSIYFTDYKGGERHFKWNTYPCPPGTGFRATEVTRDGTTGYEFQHLCKWDEDEGEKELEFFRKIKEGISQEYLEFRDGRTWINDHDILKGRIEWADENGDTDYEKVFIIDGKRITMESFIKMLEPYEGFNFEFKITE